MRTMIAWVLLGLAAGAAAQERTETQELVGQLGGRSALLVLHGVQRPDASWHVTGEYLLLPTMARRFLEGERSPELGITTLREGTSAILFGRVPTGELRGTWRGGAFRGARYAPGGQERERFEFSDEFPPMEGYSAAVHCEAGDARYRSTLAYTADNGRLKSFEWRSKLAPGGHGCEVGGLAQEPLRGGLRLAAGRCSVTLRDLGEFIKVAAEGCVERCGSQAYLEPLLVDRRGQCRLLRAAAP